MPNEQTSVPLFASGQVLTAANLNLSAGTGVPVFTSTTTRNAAFGGANEKVLSAGQLCYLSATNEVQYYNGSTWQAVGAVDTNGLVYLGKTTGSGTSVSLPANTFTSTYANYRIILRYTADINCGVTIRMRASGVDNTTTGYIRAYNGVTSAGAASLNYQTSQTSWNFSAYNTGLQTPYFVLDILSPQEARVTNFVGSGFGSSASVERSFDITGIFNGSAQFDSMSFIADSGAILSPVAYVYGYQGV